MFSLKRIVRTDQRHGRGVEYKLMTNRPQTQTRMPTDSGRRDDTRDDPRRGSRPWAMLVLATIGFAVNFWAWALLSPLGPKFKDVLHLSPF